MGRGFDGLARALHWAGLGTLGRAHLRASPGCPANLVNVLSHVSNFHDTLSCDHDGNQNLSMQNSGTVFAFSRKVKVAACSNRNSIVKSEAEKQLAVLNYHSFCGFER